jgi:mercuric ion binding protein
MMSQTKLALVAVAAFATLVGAGALCPLCVGGVPPLDARQVAPQARDTATVRLHISGMTCGSCPLTARMALKRIPGVLSAAVTLDDSLGVVRYDPRKVSPSHIAANLTRLTGYGARVIAESAKAAHRSGQ